MYGVSLVVSKCFITFSELIFLSPKIRVSTQRCCFTLYPVYWTSVRRILVHWCWTEPTIVGFWVRIKRRKLDVGWISSGFLSFLFFASLFLFVCDDQIQTTAAKHNLSVYLTLFCFFNYNLFWLFSSDCSYLCVLLLFFISFLFPLDFCFYCCYFLLHFIYCLRSEIVRPPYIVSFSNRMSSSPISYSLLMST